MRSLIHRASSSAARARSVSLLLICALTPVAGLGAQRNFTAASSLPVLARGPTGSWDSGWVGVPSVVDVDGTLFLYYTGATQSLSFGWNSGAAIGLATSTDNGASWTKKPNPVLTGRSRGFDQGVLGCAVARTAGIFVMVYGALANPSPNAPPTACGFAWSVDPGRDYRLDVYARHGPPRLVDVALPYVSAATARIPVPPFGTLGLDPAFLVPLPPSVIPQLAGAGSVTATIPNDPRLVGLSIHAQALLLQWPRSALLTNVRSDEFWQ